MTAGQFVRSGQLRLRSLRLAIAAHSASAGYIGYVGRRNLGDDAMFVAARMGLAPLGLRPLPFNRRGMQIAAHLRRQQPLPMVVLGGGTLIGRRGWAHRFATATEAFRPLLRVAVGVGVEEPVNGRFAELTDWDELGLWTDHLGGFDHLTVRGPRSAEILSRFGIHAEVVGDPAFLLRNRFPVIVSAARRDVAVINIADEGVTWAEDHQACLRRLVPPIRHLSRSGFDVVVLVVNARDFAASEEFYRSLDLRRSRLIDVSNNLNEAMQVLGHAKLAITERLHASVLAAIAATPCLMVDYRPKCGDVRQSLGGAIRFVRVDDLCPTQVTDVLEHLLSDWDEASGRLEDSVASVAAKVEADFRAVRDLVPASTS